MTLSRSSTCILTVLTLGAIAAPFATVYAQDAGDPVVPPPVTVPDVVTTTTTTVPTTTSSTPATTTTTTTTAAPTTTTRPPASSGTTSTSTSTSTTAPGTATGTTTTTAAPVVPTCPGTTPDAAGQVASPDGGPACPTDTTLPPPVDVPPAAPALGIKAPKALGDILITIRIMESGQRYDIPPNRGGASGAYQYIDSTWNNFKGFPSAYLAPREVQDERALMDVQSILTRWRGDVSMVPVIWYFPKAAGDAALMDAVPLPGAGNRLTVREYQHRWLDLLGFITGNPVQYRLASLPPDLRFLAGLPPEVMPPTAELTGVTFPVLGAAVLAPPAPCTTEVCEAGAPAVVYGQTLQPVMAVVDGVVTAVEPGDPVSGEVSLTVTDIFGRTFHYSGFNDDNPGTDDGAAPRSLRLSALGQVGATVHAGQILGYMGNTDPMPDSEHVGLGDEPVWPHIRLTIRDADGTPFDTDVLVAEAQQREACHVAIGPWSVVPDGNPDDRDDVKVSAVVNGGWTIHSDGTVTAYGRSTLIVPPQDCVWAPLDAFGPGAAGGTPPPGWGLPFDIPAAHFVTGASADGGFNPTQLLRRP